MKMSNIKDASTTTKAKEISQEVKELEVQIMAEKVKLNIAANDQKLEEQKKNLLEVRKDRLKRSVELFKISAKKIRTKFVQRSTIHSKFLIAEQCYDKLLKTYEENHLQIEPNMQSAINMSITSHKYISDFQKQAESLQKQMELLEAKIDENYLTINNLLENFHYPTKTV